MTAARYRPGDWTLLAQLPSAGDAAGAVVLLPPGTAPDVTARVWDALTVDSGTGGLPVGDPTTIGAFAGAVLGTADGVVLRIAGTTVTPAVRGGGTVAVAAEHGERHWVDGTASEVVADAHAVTVHTGTGTGTGDPADAADAHAVWLPLRAGIVAAAAFRLTLRDPRPAPGSSPAAVIPAPPAAAPTIGVDRPATGPLVLARVCSDGHANPPAASDCGRCGRALAAEPRRVPRPPLGAFTLTDGRRITLDRPLVVGRQPAVSRGAGADMPRVVTVPSPHGDVSRSHVRVRLDGWHVLLDDLASTNGTLLRRPGQPPRRLGRGESTMLLDGDVVDLGDDVALTFEARS